MPEIIRSKDNKHTKIQTNILISKKKKMLSTSSVSFVSQDDFGNTQVVPIVTNVETYSYASNSVVLSAASYISWKYQTLEHPWYPAFDISGLPIPSEDYKSEDLSLHPLFEAWCDILCQTIFKGSAVRQENQLFIAIPVSMDYLNKVKTVLQIQLTLEKNASLEKIFGITQVKRSNKKVALMNFATSQLRQDQLQSKINLPSLILGCLFDNQKWDYFCILKGEVPSKEKILEYNTVILPGSSYSAMDSVPEIDLFSSELSQALEEQTYLKVLSICFGHQLISRIFKAPITRKIRFEGQENVSFFPEVFQKFSFLEGLKKFNGSPLRMPEHHQDYVENVPEGFELLAKSESCAVEAMIKKDGKILSFQFHPEYLSDYAVSFENRLKVAQPQYQMSFHLNVSEQFKEAHLSACSEVRLCMKNFLA